MTAPQPAWRKKTTPCPFYKTGRCVFQDKCNFIHDGVIDHRQLGMRATVPAYRRTPENSVDSFSSSEDDDERPIKEPIDEHTAAAPSLIFSSIYGTHPHPINRLQLAEVDLPVSPESLPDTPARFGQRRPSSGQLSRTSGAHTLAINSPVSSRAPSRPVSASLGIGLGGRGQGLAEVFTALATSQAHATALPPSSPDSLPSPLSLSPKPPPLEGQDVVVQDDNFTLEQFPFKLALSNQSSLLLNRTTRAAARENARRASSLPQSSATPSPASKRPSNSSAPDRYSVTPLSYRPGVDDSFERPPSHSRSGSGSYRSRSVMQEDEPDEAFDAENEDDDGDDGYEDDEPQFVEESPSFEALQSYPRDVSIEPSPDPIRGEFQATVQEEEEGLRRPARRADSDRKIDHERLLDELEERLNIEPGRRRARSGTSASTATTAQNAARGGNSSTTVPGTSARWERKSRNVVIPKSGVDMDFAKGMLESLFAKRAEVVLEELSQEEEEEDEEEQEEIEEEEQEQEKEEWQQEVEQRAERDLEDNIEPESVFEERMSDRLAGEESVKWERMEGLGSTDVAERQHAQGDDLSFSSQSSPGDRNFLPTDWDIGSLDLDAHPLDLDVRSVHSDSHTLLEGLPLQIGPEPQAATREPQLEAKESPDMEGDEEDRSDSDHEFSEHFLSDDDPTEDYAELIEGEAVLTSSVVLRREIPRETSLPEIEATRNMSRMGSLQSSVRSRGESLMEAVPEETVELTLPIPDSLGLAMEDLHNESSTELSVVELQTMDVVTPMPDPTPDVEPSTPEAQTMSVSAEPLVEAEVPKPRSQLKPLRLSMLYGLRTSPNGAAITPISSHSTPITPNFSAPTAHPAPSTVYPTPATAHPSHPGSGTARSIPASSISRSNSRSALSTHDVEEMTENVSVHGVGRGSFGPDSVSWFGSKKGSTRGSLGESIRKSVREPVPVHNGLQERESVLASALSPTRNDQTLLRQLTGPVPESTVPVDDDVRPLPVIWDDETEASQTSDSSPERRNTSHSPSQSILVPVFDIPMEEETMPTATSERMDSLPRYPAFVNVEGNSPRVSEGRSPLPSPRLEPPMPSTLEPRVRQQRQPPVRNRKWADDSNEDSIGSLPVFDAPAPQAPPSAPPSQHLGYPRYAYPPLPNTAPLSISPRNITPSMMQESGDPQVPYTAPLTAPLHLRLKMAAQGEGAPSPWMTEHFTNSPSSLHSSQMGSMHSASSSVTTADKTSGLKKISSVSEYPDETESAQRGVFGNPGPGPSTMMTYSARKLTAEALASPILLQTPPHGRVASLIEGPQVGSPRARSITPRTPRADSAANGISNSPGVEDEPTLRIISRGPTTEPDLSARSTSARYTLLQTPPKSALDKLPSHDRGPTLMSPQLSTPSPRRSPVMPLTAPSPLQILRRNMMTRPGSDSPGFLSPQPRFSHLPQSRSSRHQHHGSLAPTTSTRHEDSRNTPMSAPLARDRRSLTPAVRFSGMSPRPGSPSHSIQSATSQTKPLLFFAIAKNSAQEVERLLQGGEVQPNDKAGPEDLPALAFTLANEQLTDKTQIVKSLLSHGADPASVLQRRTGTGEFDDNELALSNRIEQGINPAIRYYLNRKRMTIPALQAELLEKNKFGALTRTGFSIIGQDSALDELIRVVAGHCRRQTLNPLVIVFSGGPGCGKSLLASKIGPLLHVPTFTVNMTNLRNESSLFQYISMTTKAGNPQIPLVDFLRVNEGQRCVVVLEEIEKAADKTVWHSLLMPWEWGKATVISPTSNEQIDIDTTQVIWIATSNSGDDATLKFFAERSRPSHAGGYTGESALARLAHGPRPADNFTRKDYLQLMQAVRKRLGELLGSSIISRVSSVLPFLPFTEEEVLALASESLSAMREAQKSEQSTEDVDWDSLLQQAVGEYIPGEGARSVHRAVQRAFDEITDW